MLDLTGILFSSLMMLYVIVQAVRLDSIRPWFERPPKQPDTNVDSGDGTRRVVPWRERRP